MTYNGNQNEQDPARDKMIRWPLKQAGFTKTQKYVIGLVTFMSLIEDKPIVFG